MAASLGMTRGIARALLGKAPCSTPVALLHTSRVLSARAGAGSGKKDSSKRAESPREEPKETVDLEQEWRRLRAKTFPMPREKDPLAAPIKKALQERQRKRRLGLLDESESDEQFVERYRAQLEKQQKRREWFEKRQKMEEEFRADKERNRDAPMKRMERRAVSPKAKTFTRLRSAPDEVLEREYLDPDEPARPRGLDIAVIGRPNAGKSSIVNSLVNVTVSAVSPKYNTTRDRVLGILTEKDTQLTFYDTPGLIKPKESHQYVRELVTTAAETVESVDISMLVVDAVKRLDDDAMEALEKFVTTSAQVSSPLMLVMNKSDLVGERDELNLKHKIRDISQMIEDVYKNHYEEDEDAELNISPLMYIGDNALHVSALKGTGMSRLKSTLMRLAVDRPWTYHSSFKSDQSDLDLVTEIIREKLFRRYNKELPYTIEQENVGWTRFRDRSIRIDQDLFVPAARVRKMVVGQNGDSIRSVGVAAREEIERLLGCPVHLYLNVRVRS